MPALGGSGRPPSWWADLTPTQRATIVARLRKVRKTDQSVPDTTSWPK